MNPITSTKKFTIGKMTKEQSLLDEIYQFYGKKKGICGQINLWIKEKGYIFVGEVFREVSKRNREWRYFAAVVSRQKIYFVDN